MDEKIRKFLYETYLLTEDEKIVIDHLLDLIVVDQKDIVILDTGHRGDIRRMERALAVFLLGLSCFVKCKICLFTYSIRTSIGMVSTISNLAPNCVNLSDRYNMTLCDNQVKVLPYSGQHPMFVNKENILIYANVDTTIVEHYLQFRENFKAIKRRLICYL